MTQFPEYILSRFLTTFKVIPLSGSMPILDPTRETKIISTPTLPVCKRTVSHAL